VHHPSGNVTSQAVARVSRLREVTYDITRLGLFLWLALHTRLKLHSESLGIERRLSSRWQLWGFRGYERRCGRRAGGVVAVQVRLEVRFRM
jgi:hypothetical protein